MGAVRLPDDLAKETLHNKHKQTQTDPGNNGGEHTQRKTQTQAVTHVYSRYAQTNQTVIIILECVRVTRMYNEKPNVIQRATSQLSVLWPMFPDTLATYLNPVS